MPQRKHGNPSLNFQPGREIIEDHDGSLNGSVTWEGDASNRLPIIGEAHPDDGRLMMHRRRIIRLNQGKIRVIGDYIGITRDPTEIQIQFPSGNNTEAIETHPNFPDFAGTKCNPKNGAKFDEDTGEFLGFFAPITNCDSAPVNRKVGLRSYLAPSFIVYASYWTYARPTLRDLFKIDNNISNAPGFRKPPNVKNMLLVGMPYRQVGKLYQVTDQYMGSGPDGWDEDIYG